MSYVIPSFKSSILTLSMSETLDIETLSNLFDTIIEYFTTMKMEDHDAYVIKTIGYNNNFHIKIAKLMSIYLDATNKIKSPFRNYDNGWKDIETIFENTFNPTSLVLDILHNMSVDYENFCNTISNKMSNQCGFIIPLRTKSIVCDFKCDMIPYWDRTVRTSVQNTICEGSPLLLNIDRERTIKLVYDNLSDDKIIPTNIWYPETGMYKNIRGLIWMLVHKIGIYVDPMIVDVENVTLCTLPSKLSNLIYLLGQADVSEKIILVADLAVNIKKDVITLSGDNSTKLSRYLITILNHLSNVNSNQTLNTINGNLSEILTSNGNVHKIYKTTTDYRIREQQLCYTLDSGIIFEILSKYPEIEHGSFISDIYKNMCPMQVTYILSIFDKYLHRTISVTDGIIRLDEIPNISEQMPIHIDHARIMSSAVKCRRDHEKFKNVSYELLNVNKLPESFNLDTCNPDIIKTMYSCYNSGNNIIFSTVSAVILEYLFNIGCRSSDKITVLKQLSEFEINKINEILNVEEEEKYITHSLDVHDNPIIQRFVGHDNEIKRVNYDGILEFITRNLDNFGNSIGFQHILPYVFNVQTSFYTILSLIKYEKLKDWDNKFTRPAILRWICALILTSNAPYSIKRSITNHYGTDNIDICGSVTKHTVHKLNLTIPKLNAFNLNEIYSKKSDSSILTELRRIGIKNADKLLSEEFE